MVFLTKRFRIECQAQWFLSGWRWHTDQFVGTETLTSPEQRIPQENGLRKVKTHTEWFQTLQGNSPSGCNYSPEVLLAKEELARVWLLFNRMFEQGIREWSSSVMEGMKGEKARLLCKLCQCQHFLYCSRSENNHPDPMEGSLAAGVGIAMEFLALLPFQACCHSHLFAPPQQQEWLSNLWGFRCVLATLPHPPSEKAPPN